MNPVLKNILGPLARHWLGALTALLVGRGWMKQEEAATAVAQLSDDMVSNLVVSFFIALLPAGWSFCGRQLARLRERLALKLGTGPSEKEVKRMISDVPIGRRIEAVLTADPAKIIRPAARKA